MSILPFFKHEVTIIFRSKFNFLISYLFFMLIIFIFPLSFSYDTEVINYFLPVIIWVAVIISSLLSIEYNYRDEYENGFIDYLILSSNRLILVLYSKIVLGWLLNGIPLSIFSFVFFYFLTGDYNSSCCLLKTLLPGTLTINSLGCLGSIMTIGLNRANIILLIIIIPLLIPILLLSLHALKFAQNEMSYDLQLILSIFFLFFSFFIVPIICSFLLKLGID